MPKLLSNIFVVILCIVGLTGLKHYGQFKSNLRIKSNVVDGARPNMQALKDFSPRNNAFTVSVKVKSLYRVGELLQMTIVSPKDGLVWVAFVDPNDEVKLLLPNQYQTANKITAGVPLELPSQGASWEVLAEPPKGESVFVVIVTTDDVKPQDIVADMPAPLASVFKTTANTRGLLELLGIVGKNTHWSLGWYSVWVA